ncbi:TIGR03757 family integrating conjugative element protein [Morganella morganii]|nr:TIGR03757 family integrating conjugative element protein [Morganella morganii]
MKLLTFLFFFLLMLPFSGITSTVLYTTQDKPPDNSDDTLEVVYLDAADTLTDEWFNEQEVDLNEANPPQITAWLQTPEWKTQEQELVHLYQGLIRAWLLGVERVPAVVVDDQWVVYGLTDIHRAKNEIQQFQQENGGVR